MNLPPFKFALVTKVYVFSACSPEIKKKNTIKKILHCSENYSVHVRLYVCNYWYLLKTL